MDLIDELTLSLLAKHEPKRLLYACVRQRPGYKPPEPKYWRQHAECCVDERKWAPNSWNYSLTPFDLPEAENSRKGVCAVCATEH